MYGDNKAVDTLSGACEVRRATVTERLQQEREHLKRRLADVEAALASLEANPAVQTVLDMIQKVTHL